MASQTGPSSHPSDLAAPFSIVADAPGFVAVAKPVGIASIPERPPRAANADRSDNLRSEQGSASVVDRLSRQLGAKLWVVHRLDKEVSGILLFAKDAATHRSLSMAFEQHQVTKHYLAMVWGSAPAEQHMIDAPIHQFGSGRMGVAARGKPSQTRLDLLVPGPPASLLALSPLSGRRHQLRVHCYHIGHPIVGDSRYGDRVVQSQWPRLLLHSTHVGFTLGSQRVDIVCKPDAGFIALAESQRAGVAEVIESWRPPGH